ncbi:MAG: Uncharacterized protein FD167_4162 [bacterium]|nr:MAG: Uncharacterized protein FD167_4162 [bacterium]
MSSSQADSWLGSHIENLKNLTSPFEEYNKFCQEFGISPVVIAGTKNYLVGCREIHKLKFVVINSCWFSRDDEDKNKLWVGLPQLKLMLASEQLIHEDNYDTDSITIATLHHPPDWLHEEETQSCGSRYVTYRHLSERSHVILSGHVHSSTIVNPDRKFDSAYLFVGGATYAGSDYWNNFSIYQINIPERTISRKAFECDPREDKWLERPDKEIINRSLKKKTL